MPGFRKLKCFILQEGECAAECPLCSGAYVQCLSQHHGQRRRNCTGQDQRLWGTTESWKGLELWFSSCLVKGWEVYFLFLLVCLLGVFLRQNKHILESYSELMFRVFFTTDTVTRGIVKANWFFFGGGEITLLCQWAKCTHEFFWNWSKVL